MTPTPTEIASKKYENRRVLAIPAVHIQALIDEYRRSTARKKPEGQALSKSPKDDVVSSLPPEPMQHFGWLETLIHARFPEHNLVFRNLG